MASDEKCPLCNGDHQTIAVRGIRGCTFPIEHRDFVRDLQRRAEIGARAVELLRVSLSAAEADLKNEPWKDAPGYGFVEVQVDIHGELDKWQSVLADARAAGMVVS